MIKVARSPKPAILERNKQPWTDALLRASTVAGKRKVEGKYKHPSIKDVLVAMFHGKCAYCESKISHIAYGHIEHFKPKSTFPELTFEWTNLLLSCPICNGPECKGDCFPVVSEGGPLINPCDDTPAEHFEFVFDTAAKLASVIGKTIRGQTTEKILGLNRVDLREYRSKVVMTLYALSVYAATDPAAQALLEEACRDDGEYAAFIRSFPR
ncbi:MAG: retron system putative HNH endonuclease [Syntrophales bacterium]|nr:retron system putative HNH endonuclease [Syntrophales bacterium]